jgi:hypothetical protein
MSITTTILCTIYAYIKGKLNEYRVPTQFVPTPFTICIIQSVQDAFLNFGLNAVFGKHRKSVVLSSDQ